MEVSINLRKSKVVKITIPKEIDFIDHMVEKYVLSKTVRVLAWCKRFIDNLVSNKKTSSALFTEETQAIMKLLIKQAQAENEVMENFKDKSVKPNLKKDQDVIYMCKGRIQRE